MGCFSLVCVLQRFINSLGSRWKLDGRNLRVRVASTAFGWDADVCVCGWGGVGGSRVGRIFLPPETTGLCECVPTWWTYAKPSGCGAVHVRMFSLFLFARLACCLTALAGAPVLAW